MKFKRSNGVKIEAVQFTRNIEEIDRLIIFSGYNYNQCQTIIPRTPYGKAQLIIKSDIDKSYFNLSEGDWLVKEGDKMYILPDSEIKTFYTPIKSRKPKEIKEDK